MAETAQTDFEITSIEKVRNGESLAVSIDGYKKGKPNKRLVIKRPHLNIYNVSIISTQKNRTIEHTAKRINSLPTVGETRIHTENLLFPGRYHIKFDVADPSGALESRLNNPENLFR